MTISEIMVKEFTCKCKSHNWNRDGGNIGGIEKSLRARLRRIEERYISASSIWWNPLILNCWDNKLVEKFPNLNPRPTVEELHLVLHGSKIGFNSKNPYKEKGFVPDPQDPRRWKYDKDEYQRIILHEAEKRKETMRKIIRERTA